MNYGLNDNEISRLYEGIVEPEKVKFDPVEIEEIGYYSMDELQTMMSDEKIKFCGWFVQILNWYCLLYTSPSPRDRTRSRMPSSA